MSRHVKFDVELSDSVAHRMNVIAIENDESLERTVIKALALYVVAHNAVKAGKKVGIAAADDSLETEFTGI